MTRGVRRLSGVWDADQAGVDRVRPFVGFALAAALCAVLTGAAANGVGLGDLFHPARPIAGADGAPAGRADRVVGDLDDAPSVVRLPAELAARQPGTTVPDADRESTGESARSVRAWSTSSRRDLPPRGADLVSPRSGPARR